VERFLSPDVDLDPEQFLEVLNQPGMIQQTPARFPGDQQIEVAILIGFTAGHRAEYAHVARNVSRVTIVLLCDKSRNLTMLSY
jgi:hypothetical protein